MGIIEPLYRFSGGPGGFLFQAAIGRISQHPRAASIGAARVPACGIPRKSDGGSGLPSSIRNSTEVSITEIAVGGGDAAFPQAGSQLGVRCIRVGNVIGRSQGALVALGEEEIQEWGMDPSRGGGIRCGGDRDPGNCKLPGKLQILLFQILNPHVNYSSIITLHSCFTR